MSEASLNMENQKNTTSKSIFSYHRSWSIFMGSLCALCWSYSNILYSLIPFDTPIFILSNVTVTIIVTLPLCLKYRETVQKSLTGWGTVVMVSIVGFIDFALLLALVPALNLAPIGDVVCLLATRVIWTTIFEAIQQRHCVRLGRWFVIVMSITGVVLITQPSVIFNQPASEEKLYPRRGEAFLLAAIIGFLQSVQYILYNVNPQVDWVAWQAVSVPCGLVVVGVAFLFSYVSGPRMTVGDMSAIRSISVVCGSTDVLGVLLISVFDFLGRLCRTFSAQEDCASTVVLTSALDIPFSYMWGWLYGDQQLQLLQLLGALLIMVSVVLISLPCVQRDPEQTDEAQKQTEKQTEETEKQTDETEKQTDETDETKEQTDEIEKQTDEIEKQSDETEKQTDEKEKKTGKEMERDETARMSETGRVKSETHRHAKQRKETNTQDRHNTPLLSEDGRK